MFPLSSAIAVLPLFFITSGSIISPTCPPNHYSHAIGKDQRCCKLCPPGTFLKSRCSDRNESECVECPPNHYTETYNQYTSCIRCTTCHARTFSKKNCSRTSDTVCNCVDGYFYKGISNACEKCRDCPIGEGVVDECSHSSRRTCQKCIEGFSFSNKKNGRCLSCQNCGVNEIKIANCSVSQDTQCKKAPTPPKRPVGSNKINLIVISIAVCLLVVTIIVIIIVVRKKVTINCCHRGGGQPTIVSTIERRTPQPRASTSLDAHEEQVLLRVKMVPPTEEPQENGMSISDLVYPVWEELAKKLDPDAFRHKNWKSLAGLLSYTQIDIQSFARDESPTIRVLMEYGTQKECSVIRLYRALIKIKREDCARLLEPYVTSKKSDV